LIPLEEFQRRLYHLAELADALPEFAARPGGTWLYHQILTEIDQLSVIGWEYWCEAVKVRHTMHGGSNAADSGETGGEDA